MKSRKTFFRFLALLAVLTLLAGCRARQDKVEAGEITQTPEKTAWSEAEASISSALLGSPAGKCEWEMLGWREQERYLWAFCQSGPGADASGVSAPVVARVTAGGGIESVTAVNEGIDFTTRVRRSFPPAVQEKILAQDFDLFTFLSHLEGRWNNALLPPEIYQQSRDTLPVSGEAAAPALTAATAAQIIEKQAFGEGGINSVQILPDGQIAFNGSRGLKFWRRGTNDMEEAFPDLLRDRNGFLSADGKYLAAVNGSMVQVYDIGSGALISQINTSGVSGDTRKVQFLADGLTVAVEKNPPSEGFSHSQLGLYRLMGGELVESWQPGGVNFLISPNGYYLVGLNDTTGTTVWSIPNKAKWQTLPVFAQAASFSADGQILAIADRTSVILYWVWDGFEIGRLAKNLGHINGLALSPDGKLLLTWSDKMPATLWSVPQLERVESVDIFDVSAAAFTADGARIVLVGDTKVTEYDIGEGSSSYSFSLVFSGVTDLSFAPNRSYSQGQRLAAAYQAGPNNSLIVNWDASTGGQLFLRNEFNANYLVHTGEATGIALGSRENTVQIIDADEGHLLRTFKGPSSPVLGLAVDGLGHLAAGSRNEVRVYSLSDPDESLGSDIRVGGGWVTNVIWPCFLAAAVDDGNIHIWNYQTGEKLRKILMPVPGHDILLAAPPDCSEILAAQNETVYRVQAQTWENLAGYKLPSRISALAISPDGTLVAIGLNDGSIHLVDHTTGEELNVLKSHSGTVTALEFSPDGSLLASGGWDGMVFLWGAE